MSENAEFASELQQLGAMGTPTTVIDEQVIVGFDKKKIGDALNL